MAITQEFDLNLIPSSAPVVVHVDQYDHGTGRLVASLYNGETPYSPSSASVYVQGTKPDGKYFISSDGISLEGNVITADLKKVMTQAAGRTRTQFVVAEPTGRTGTFVFWLDVQATAMPDDSEISSSDMSMIEEAVETVQEAVIQSAGYAQASSDNAENSEAWAVGTRNGEDVPSTDETYHNNSRYWAEQAASSASHGGHTIEDENGTPMTARTYLQFINADVVDDPTNNCTIVTPRGGTGGSTIIVSTTESSLHNKNVTISDGTTTDTEQFSAEGVATFTGITMTGMLTITSTDGTETATDTLNVPYYGNYTKAIAFVTFNATLNISTSASSLYGQTITITKGGSTVGTTAFSAVGAASYTVHETGSYTLECEGYSASVTVSAETTYNVTINAGLALSEWITAGSTTEHPLDPTDYADFAALEADEKAVRQLMLVHDAVDYLATAPAGDTLMQSVINSNVCAKWINNSDYALDTLSANSDIASEMATADKYGFGEWIITDSTTTPVTWGAKGNVPIMTANNAPYGVASANNEANGAAWKAFDGIDSTPWYPSGDITPITLTYNSINAIKAKRAKLRISGVARIGTLTISGSFDNSTWTPIYTDTNPSSHIADETDVYIDLNSAQYYPYHKVEIVKSVANAVAIYTLQFYGHEETLVNGVPTPNYSEKEFATGSTRKTIYDHGVEVESIVTFTSGSSFATKESDQLYGGTNTAPTKYTFCTDNPVNFANESYTTLNVILGNILYQSGSVAGSGYVAVMRNKRIVQSGDIVGEKDLPIPASSLTVSLDVSNISESAYPAFYDSASSLIRKATIKEMWLE